LRKSSTVWIWQHDKRTDDNKIILNCVRKWMKNVKKRPEKAKNLQEKSILGQGRSVNFKIQVVTSLPKN
jgi:hypothetical protein